MCSFWWQNDSKKNPPKIAPSTRDSKIGSKSNSVRRLDRKEIRSGVRRTSFFDWIVGRNTTTTTKEDKKDGWKYYYFVCYLCLVERWKWNYYWSARLQSFNKIFFSLNIIIISNSIPFVYALRYLCKQYDGKRTKWEEKNQIYYLIEVLFFSYFHFE